MYNAILCTFLPHLDKFEMTPGTEISRISLYSKPLLA